LRIDGGGTADQNCRDHGLNHHLGEHLLSPWFRRRTR
jgi:hypothetical protein